MKIILHSFIFAKKAMQEMELPIKNFLLAFLFLPLFLFGNNEIAYFLKQGDEARKAHRDWDAISAYKKIMELDSNHLQALWNLGSLYSRQGWMDFDKEKKKIYHEKSREYAEKIYSKYPHTFEANFLMAGTIARISEYESPKNRVQAAWDIKKYGEIALKLAPDNPEVWWLFGWWNFKLSNANWLERSLADLLFGGLPKGTSLEKAIECLNKAIQLKPDYTVYRYDLAQFYEYMGNEIFALEILKKALALIPKTPEDFHYLNHCRELMKRLQ